MEKKIYWMAFSYFLSSISAQIETKHSFGSYLLKNTLSSTKSGHEFTSEMSKESCEFGLENSLKSAQIIENMIVIDRQRNC